MNQAQNAQRAIENWIVGGQPPRKSLWLRRDGISVHMMARTKQPPVSLLMPLDSCFEVRILCIDYNNGFILIRPLTVDDKYVKLRQKLQQQSKMEHCRANYIEEDGIYLVPNDHGLMFRGVLVGQPSENNLFYGIDDGERKVVKAEDTFQLPDELQSFPPSSFCGILPWYTSSSQYEELSSVNTNIICLCKINKVLPGHFMDYPTAMYPPVLFIQLYRLTADNYYIEIISKQKPNSIIHCAEYLWPRIAVFNSSWMGKIDQHIMSNFRRISLSDHEIVQTRIASDNFLFKPYNISLPCQVKAIITRRVRKNIYWMRDANILKILYENLIDPYEHAKYSIVDIIKYGVEFSCLVRLTRPFRDSSLFDRYYVYRAVVFELDEESRNCSVHLIDFGLSITCSTENLYSFENQPDIVREVPSAAFKCLINTISLQRIGRNGRKLKPTEEELCVVELVYKYRNRYVGDMILEMQQLEHEPESELIRDYNTDESVENFTTTDMNIRAFSSNRRIRAIYDEGQWYQPTLYSCAENSNIAIRNEVMLSSIQLDVLQISEKVNNIANAKLASLQLALANCGRCDLNLTPSMHQACRERGFSRSHSKFAQAEQLSYDEALDNSQFSKWNFLWKETNADLNQNSTYKIRNESNLGRQWVRPTTGKSHLSGITVSKSLHRSSIYENFSLYGTAEFTKHSQYRYSQNELGRIDRRQLLAKKAQFQKYKGKRNYKKHVDTFQNCCNDKYEGEQSFVEQNSEIFYIRRLRNKEGELLYTSDESSVDETQCVEAQCHNRKEDDDSAAEKEIVETNLLEKDLFLDIDGPVAASIPLKQYDVKYKAFFEHVKVKVGEELLVKRSDDDRDNLKWPLFFVQIQRDDLLDLLEEQLDSLEPTDSISESELQVGTLCVSYCRAFDSLFRAVITNVCDTGIEVHYIDYGNYEMVKSNDLKSINNLSDISRTHPGMAIPCILYNAQNSDTLAVDDDLVANLKKKVSCEHQSFLLRVIKEDGNGICTVEYISS